MKKKILTCNKIFDKTEIRKLIEWFTYNYGPIRTTKLLDKLKYNGFKHATNAGISLGLEDLKIPPSKEKLFNNTEKELTENLNKLEKGKINIVERTQKIIESWSITNELLKEETVKNLRQTDLLNPVYMMTFSGARGNISQIKQLIGMRGLMSDSQGEIINLPIKSNLKEGLKITEYFISCYGARKGLVDTALKTANSGYLTRRLIYVSQSQIIKRPNCHSKSGMLIINNSETKKKYTTSIEKMIGRVLANDILDKGTNRTLYKKGQDICKYIAKDLMKIKKLYLRSSLNCKLNTGTCQLCYGWNIGNGRMSQLGESVGILAAQSIGEPGTQLTMRTFHTGGIFAGEVAQTINSPHNGIINYESNSGGKKIETKFKEKAFLTLNDKKITITENKKLISQLIVPKYTLIFTKPNKKVFYKQTIGETGDWKKLFNQKLKENMEIKEIRSDISGKIKFNPSEIENKKIWTISGNIISYQKIYYNLKLKKYKLKKFITTKTIQAKQKKKIAEIESTSLITNLENLIKFKVMTTNTHENLIDNTHYILNKVNNKDKKYFTSKNVNQRILRINKAEIKIGNYIEPHGKIKSNCLNKYPSQTIEIKNKTITIKKIRINTIGPNARLNIKNDSLIKKTDVLYYDYYKSRKTEDIVQGLPRIEELLEMKKTSNLLSQKNNPQEKLKKEFYKLEKKYTNMIAVRKSREKIQRYLINKIQLVYLTQGVKIADKHMEIIIKQITSKSIITEKGDSKLMVGEIIDHNKIEKANKIFKNKIKCEPILLGISKLSLSNESFISEASFQETSRVLSKSAIQGKIDWLYGLKENIVLSNLIPVGTGYKIYNK
uniref:DNA-directed RNA polymerase n=1 Tax=Monomorphina aenigmatica TaxID=304863 RepID=L0BGM4_MONAE|nr:beta'' subunit of RNA polymerase [Monomorphina aenigmatica]AFZ88780.1 beta'' subunit of RNA polymerase [Monomorphina aenigmatica]